MALNIIIILVAWDRRRQSCKKIERRQKCGGVELLSQKSQSVTFNSKLDYMWVRLLFTHL